MNARAAKAFVFVLLTWVAGLTGASGAGLAELAPWLVRFSGGLKGVYTPVEGRPLAWNLAWSPADGANRRGEITVTGADMALGVELSFDTTDNRLSWRVVDGKVDLAAWLPALATRPELTEALKGMTATGSLVITGEGALKGDVIEGTLNVSCMDGTLKNEEQDWTLEGVSIRAGGDVAELAKGRVPVEVDVRTITTGRFGARALKVKATLVDFTLAEASSVALEIAGGRVTAKPFTVALGEPNLWVDISMTRVGLQDIAALVPDFLAEGRGRVNGAVRINWSKASGLSLGTGYISIDASEPAEIRFMPNPGLLTGSLPPDVLGLYPGLTNVEMGQATLLAERFDVRLSPEGDGEGRSASVLIAGGPVDKTLKAPLVLAINVRGPLAPLIKLGSSISGLK